MSRSIHYVAYLALLGLLFINPGVRAQTKMNAVNGTGHTTGTAGTASLSMDGTAHTATVTVTVVEADTVLEDGESHRMKTRHLFDFGSGDSFTTEEIITMTPAGTPSMYKMAAVGSVKEGTGAYSTARGQLHLQGDMNMDKSEADWSVKGSVCNPCN